jgi:gamma-butyrobetaine dioxygenase
VFTSIIEQQENVFKTRLEKGDLVIFNNRRVLHGRDEFDSNSGERHFKGTYVDEDGFLDKLRVLLNKGI